VKNRPNIIIVPDRKTIDLIKEQKTEDWYVGWCSGRDVYILDRNNYEIIVICNGCTDNTANVTRSINSKIICLETDIQSKTNAINIGEKISRYFPRIYLDADIIVSLNTIDALCAKLNEGYLAASPEVKMNLDSCSYLVKAYYNIWLSLPYCKSGMIGTGVYALSEKGRNVFTKFPDVIADDEYVRLNFSNEERVRLDGYYSIVNAPKNIFGLLRIKTRSRLGGYELKKRFPLLVKSEEKNYFDAVKLLLPKFYLWPYLTIYILVNIITRIRAKLLLDSNDLRWQRDDSSRE